jgi:serine/threonine protein kinase
MLKNYIIEKELGKGTYGIVYKATKKDDNKICVIKQISLQGLNQDQKKEVKLESEILKSINSKYVVKYYDSFEEENNLNIVMEYCESGDLNDFIENQKKTKHLLQENII